MPVPTFRPSTRWAAAAVAPLLLTPLVLAPLGGAASGYAPAAVDAASGPDPVRNANGWVRFTDPATAYVDPVVEPGLEQLADGTLVAAWRQTDSGTSDPSLVTATVASDNTALSPTVRLTWPNLGTDPEVLRMQGGAEVVFVGNDGTAGYFGGSNAYRLLVDEDAQVTGPTQDRYFAAGASVGVPLGSARTSDGTTVVNQVRHWREGLAGPSETEDPTYAPAPWDLSHVSIATAGDTTYLGHFTTSGSGGERGIYVGPLAAPADQEPEKLPGSWYADQPVALEGSTTGLLWAAYCTGTDACDRLVLRDVTNGRSLTVPSGEYAARVSLAPGPSGRMWVVWQSGSSAVSAVRTNKAVTRFGPVRRSAPFYTVNSIRSVVVAGRTGPADVVVNGRGEVWHRRYLAPLAASASPTRWRVDRKQTVAFAVKDAGDAVPEARVALSGRTCTTGAAGTCSIIGARTCAAHHPHRHRDPGRLRGGVGVLAGRPLVLLSSPGRHRRPGRDPRPAWFSPTPRSPWCRCGSPACPRTSAQRGRLRSVVPSA